MGTFKITLKAARINAGMTRKVAAEKIGVTPMSVYNWEEGKPIKRENLDKLLVVYGVEEKNLKLEYEEKTIANKIV